MSTLPRKIASIQVVRYSMRVRPDVYLSDDLIRLIVAWSHDSAKAGTRPKSRKRSERSCRQSFRLMEITSLQGQTLEDIIAAYSARVAPLHPDTANRKETKIVKVKSFTKWASERKLLAVKSPVQLRVLHCSAMLNPLTGCIDLHLKLHGSPTRLVWKSGGKPAT